MEDQPFKVHKAAAVEEEAHTTHPVQAAAVEERLNLLLFNLVALFMAVEMEHREAQEELRQTGVMQMRQIL